MFKTFSSAIVLSIFFAATVAAQPIIGGLKLGVPFTDAFSVQAATADVESGSSSRFTWGPFVEIRLPAKFSLEVDALHRGCNLTVAGNSTSCGTWEFPFLAKYHLIRGPIQPYVAGGLAFSHLSQASEVITPSHLTNFGVVFGAGVEIHALVLRISPEIRYTGYAVKNFETGIQSNQNQVAFLVGIGF